MVTLQKFKLLATQCAVIGSPTRSPTTSPVIHLRRRKTLRMLLGRTDRRRFQPPQSPNRGESAPETARDFRARHKLKDFFVSSPPPVEDGASPRRSEIREPLLMEPRSDGAVSGSLTARRGGIGPVRPLSAALRCRLLRKAWRPVLVTIPE